MSYRDDDDYWFDPDAADRAADEYFSYVYDSPDERLAKRNPPKQVYRDESDEYDRIRDENMNSYNRMDYDSQDRYYL